ncbi:hypothetical protein [Phytohabitans kaempferiae]|uniref:Uncharacterized protein n=1 Tax=Phytohabitans kaempferiae TaxID=1620943 RepID=A0ABV6LVL2_9ACTN
MAIRTWSRVLLAALGVAMLAAASQLGVAFGLGIVRLSRTFAVDQENQWTAQMAWVTWFAMVAAVAGAIAADRMARRHGYEGGTGSRIAYSLFAGLGAAVLVPLCMQPARFALVRATDPVLVIGLSAALGAVAGVFVALAALSYQPLLWNVVAVTAAAWLLALISVIPSLSPGDPLPEIRLGVLDLASLSAGAAQSSGVVTMPLLALALGAATAGIGRWLGRPHVTIAASGLIGPAMLCLAYLVAGPGSSTDKFQAAPYWGALVAVGAGTLGSVLATVVRRPAPSPASGDEPASSPAAASASSSAATTAEPAGARPDEPGIEPVFREPPTGEWSVPLPRHSADPDKSPASGPAAADETTDSLPTIEPQGRGGEGASSGGIFDGPTADLAAPSPPSPPPPARPAAPPPVRASRRPSTARDPGAAEAATAFSAGRRAAGYSTGELPIYGPGDDRGGRAGTPSARGRRGSGLAEEPSGRKARKRGKTAGETDAPSPEQPTDEASRQRRGLFGRRRSSPPPVEPAEKLDVPAQRGGQPRPEVPLKPRDEEYVDWVSGLSGREPDPRDPAR